MLQIAHCPRCGELFQKQTRDVCSSCFRKLDENYQLIDRFLRRRENREATIEQIEIGTEVTKYDIYYITRIGKLNTERYPNLGYPCENETCDELIPKGRLCASCLSKIKNGLEQEQKEKERVERLKAKEKETYRAYSTFDRF